MLSPRVGVGGWGGGATHGNLIQRAFPWVGILTLSLPQGREFDMSAILEDRENLEISHPRSYPHTSQSTLYWNCLFSIYPFFFFPLTLYFLITIVNITYVLFICTYLYVFYFSFSNINCLCMFKLNWIELKLNPEVTRGYRFLCVFASKFWRWAKER